MISFLCFVIGVLFGIIGMVLYAIILASSNKEHKNE